MSLLRPSMSFFNRLSTPLRPQLTNLSRTSLFSLPKRSLSYTISYKTVNEGTMSTPPTSPFAPRHFLSIADLTPEELSHLVSQARKAKRAIKAGTIQEELRDTLRGKVVAMMFSKRSTRTRVSTEGAVVHMGGHPMFLGKDDIQLGVSLLSFGCICIKLLECDWDLDGH